jgi:cytochrome c oxidase accessory protein FixG
MFMWIERRIEGDRVQRMRFDKEPMSARKFALKAAKHGAWIAVALWTGFTFVGYFTPIRPLFVEFVTLSMTGWSLFWVLFYGFATYGNAGWMREQVCKYMCPYARFQSAMFDRDTLVITYDDSRGEPRGARKKGVDYKAKGLGDCIDCTMCVQVCPTGIDIRQGLQYECIACAACIDACDEVMDKVGYPRGLVRYDTQHGIEGKKKHVLRPRTIVYATLLVLLIAGLAYSITHRNVVAVDIIRDRNALYRERPDGRIENVYNVKILNKDSQDHEFAITASGVPGIEVDYAAPTVWVGKGQVQSIPVRIRIPEDALEGGADIRVEIAATDKPELRAGGKARFIAPSDD